jgi:poly(A) polymerase
MARADDPVVARSAASRVVSTLRDAGHIAYFAGGCVRDELLGLAPTDYDVATDAVPDRVSSLFPRTMLVGVAFGVVLVPLPGATIEVATFRSEGPYSDSRRPDRVHFSDPVTDARRRDFTINALFLDPLSPPDPSMRALRRSGLPPAGRVLDYVEGLRDLDAGVVRAVGDPDQRLSEDHLRALRAVRFAARLRFSLDPATAQAITRHTTELRGVSRERIGEEIRRMFLHPTRADAASLLQNLGLDAPVLDGPHATPPLVTLSGFSSDIDDQPPYATCLAAWALDRSSAEPGPAALPSPRSRRARSRSTGLVGKWCAALRLSNEERDALASILSGYEALLHSWRSLDVAGQKRLASQGWFQEAMRVLNVRKPDLAIGIAARVAELAASEAGIAPTPLLTGEDLIEAGVEPGPQFKRILDLVYDAQLEGRVRTMAEAMELAKRLCV